MSAAISAMLGAANPLALLAAQGAMGNDAVKDMLPPAPKAAAPPVDRQAAMRAVREGQAIAWAEALRHQAANGSDEDIVRSLESITDPDVLEGALAKFKEESFLSLPLEQVLASRMDDAKLQAVFQLVSPERVQAQRRIAAMSPEERAKLDKDAKVRARSVHDALVTPNTGEREIHDNVGQQDPVQAEALRQAYRKESLGESVYLDMDHSLSGEDQDEAMAGMSGDKVASVAAALENAIDMSDDEDRVKEVLRRADPATRASLMVGPHAPKLAKAINAMDGVDKEIVAALSIGDKAGADSAHLASALLPKGLQDGHDEARDPDKLMAYLANLSPEEARAAAARFDHRARQTDGDEARTFSEALEEKFSGFQLERARALAEGDTARANAALLLEGASGSGTTEKQMEEALTDPDLSSDDPVKKAMAWSRRLSMDMWVRHLTGGEKGIKGVIRGEYDDDPLQGMDSQRAIHQLAETGRLDPAMRIRRKMDDGEIAGVAGELEDLSPEGWARARQDFRDRDWGELDETIHEEYAPTPTMTDPNPGSSPEHLKMTHAMLFGRPEDRPPMVRAMLDAQVWESERSGFTAFVEDVLGSRATDRTDRAMEHQLALARQGAPKAELDEAHDRARNGIARDDKVEDQVAEGATSALKAIGKVASVFFPAAAPAIELATSGTNILVNSAVRGERYNEKGLEDDLLQLGVDVAAMGTGKLAGNAVTKGAGDVVGEANKTAVKVASGLAENTTSGLVSSVGTSAIQGESLTKTLESAGGGLSQSTLKTMLGFLPMGSTIAGRVGGALAQGALVTAADKKTHESGTSIEDAILSTIYNAVDADVSQQGAKETGADADDNNKSDL